ncbi:hypothetical protein [Shewanella acanthi]|uniref:hypothetical protein n=1 Tax=Shewanella acanthi TaxID=2864212 RepID=UPI001C65D60C|nr:hypothetical protein [Shewanella acanthi]QYJ80485.1 hypothetical protein K0H61_09035 [Shewanella acanthi]
MKLTVTPKLLDKESSIGFLLRLAQRNGYLSIQDLVNQSVIRANVPNVDPKSLSTFSQLANVKAYEYSSHELWKFTCSINPRICLACIKSAGLIHQTHLDATVYRCTKHDLNLVNQCFHCRKSLRWDIALTNGLCTNEECGKKLIQIDTTVPENLTREQVLDCLTMSHFISAPCSTYITQKKFVEIDDYALALENGYKVLTQKDIFVEWECRQAFSSADEYPSDLNFVSSWLVKKILRSNWPIHSIINPPKITKQIESKSEKSLWLNYNTATNILKMSRPDIMLLKEFGLIFIRGNTRLTLNSVIDISPIFRMLAVHSKTDSNLDTSIYSASLLMHQNLTSLADILIGIKNKRLNTRYLPSSDISSSLYVDMSEFREFCQEQLKDKMNLIIDLGEAVKITSLSNSVLKSIKKQGVIQSPRRNPYSDDEFCYCSDAIKIRDMNRVGQLSLALENY